MESKIKKAVLSRLTLAQSLLEESDRLPSRGGYSFDENSYLFHPRHEREALVVYLLLTCFDKLGQKAKHINFRDWIKSKKAEHVNERKITNKDLHHIRTPEEITLLLLDRHSNLYGVKNSFFSGISCLSENLQETLLSSLWITHRPELSDNPNVITRTYEIEDKEQLKNLRYKFLYNKRNGFTHSLDQHLPASTPMSSDSNAWGASIWIKEGILGYHGVPIETMNHPEKGVYVVQMQDWPFVAFEILYNHLGEDFHRTNIDLHFHVFVHNYSTESPQVLRFENVPHLALKDHKKWVQAVLQAHR